jgi:hypothetical protein
MAINDHPDIRCGNEWQHRSGGPPPAVAVVRTSRRRTPPDIVLWPLCGICLDDTAAKPAPSDVVAYLDPARQRGPPPAELGDAGDPDHPDHNRPG